MPHVWCSTVLAEFSGPFDVLFNILVINGRFHVGQCLHVIVHADFGCLQLGWGHLHQAHGDSRRVARERRNVPAAAGCSGVGVLLEFSCSLASADWKHQSFVYHVGKIGARVTFTGLAEYTKVLLSQDRFGFAGVDFENICACSCLRERDVNTFLETTTDGIVEFPWHISGAEN